MAEKPLALLGEGGVGPLAQLLAEAAGSARMCASEGRTRVASDIVRCAKCGTTKSKSGCPESWPEHVDMATVTEPRTPPREFEAKLAAALPMVVTLGGLGCADGMRPAGALLPAGIEAKLLSREETQRFERACVTAARSAEQASCRGLKYGRALCC